MLACALFRSLLRRTRHKAIPSHDQVVLRIAIKDKFRKSYRAQGHFIHDGFKLGQKTLRCFNTLRNSEVLTKPVTRLISLVNQLYPPRKQDKILIERLQPRLEYEESIARKAARDEARKQPKKNWHVYDRPMPQELLTGRRKVPNFVVTNGFPFLRYAKPQPPEISGLIRYKTARRERLIQDMKRLQGQAQQDAMAEDRWENTLRGICGTGDEKQSSYSESVQAGLDYVFTELNKYNADVMERGNKLFSVHLKEKLLASKEKEQKREQRRLEKERALAAGPVNADGAVVKDPASSKTDLTNAKT